MGIERIFERSMSMTDEIWKRHASPWSVWTRVGTFPFLMLVLWSPHWIGWWALIPAFLLGAWIWLNPRLFPAPERTDNWGSKATFGERVWLNRGKIPIPGHHAFAAAALTVLSGIGTLAMLAGAVAAEPISFFSGALAGFLCKLWFCDRMVWLYDDMKDADADYAGWLRR